MPALLATLLMGCPQTGSSKVKWQPVFQLRKGSYMIVTNRHAGTPGVLACSLAVK